MTYKTENCQIFHNDTQIGNPVCVQTRQRPIRYRVTYINPNKTHQNRNLGSASTLLLFGRNFARFC